MPKYRLLVLATVCAGLGALLWIDQGPDSTSALPYRSSVSPSDKPQADKSSRSAAAAPDDAPLESPLTDLKKSDLNHWVERPLFSPSRQRPPPPPKIVPRPPVAAPPPPPKPPNFVLLGTLTNGERTIALLRREADNTSFRVELGDMIGGWQVTRVEAKSVLLERDNEPPHTVMLNSNSP